MTEENTGNEPGTEEIGDLGRINISGISESNVPSPFQPTSPIMSDFKETAPGSGNWYARSGGPPKNDWSGLDDTQTRAKKNTMQMRSFNPSNEQKAYAARVEGLPVKFKESSSLPEFYDAVIRKLEGHGLDTIAYTQDVHYPTVKPTVMVIKNHARYTVNLEHNIETINSFAKQHYDDFDQLNDNAAQEFLFNSLDDSLCVNLHKVIESEDCFIVVWLRLMDLVVSVSSAHHDKLREAIRKELPRSFPNENIKALCESYKEKADELSRADQFNPVLILTMLENLSEVSVTGSFPFQILDKHKEVKKTLDNYAGLPKDEVEKKLHKAKLDYEHILKFAIKAYNDLLKDNKWPPAQSPSDSGNQSISNLNYTADTGTITNTVLALIQTKLTKDSGLGGWVILHATVPKNQSNKRILRLPMLRKLIGKE